MHEIDFLPVGDGKDSGDAIAIRFTHPSDGRWVHVVIDGGFQDDGEALVEHVTRYYGTDHVDLAILTHPDGDHIGGMGEVVRGLDVDRLWLHDLEPSRLSRGLRKEDVPSSGKENLRECQHRGSTPTS